MAGFGLEKTVVEVDKGLVLHLGVAAIAGSFGSFVLLGELYFVHRAGVADRDATFCAVVVLFTEDFLEGSEC